MKELLLWWHFHQPLYKNYLTNKYEKPWVFLHMIRDYHMMLNFARNFKSIKQNFNFTPVLMEQLEDYRNNLELINDPTIQLFLKSPDILNQDEKQYIIDNFFNVELNKIILTNKRYSELYTKKHKNEAFSNQDLLDLQILYFFSWLDPIVQRNDAKLRTLGNNEKFNQEDKDYIWEKIKWIVDDFFLLFTELLKESHIEITTSPYYHPILPLLINTEVIKSIGVKNLPKLTFSYPQDAREQINIAVKFFKEKYNININGMWPSEGSLDEASLQMLDELGIKYVGSDDKILNYMVNSPGNNIYSYGDVNIFFRNRKLSDKLAFKYSFLPIDDAINDFIYEINNSNKLNIIIMDGENAWEHFNNNGYDFLMTFYERILDEKIKTYTLKEANDTFKKESLSNFIPSSWIDIGFPLWIGSEGKNRSWEILALIRSSINDNLLRENELMKKQLFAIEGSDWNWWYDTYYGSEDEESFDELYRLHLKNLLHMADISINVDLDVPITKIHENIYYKEPVRLLNPIINGVEDNFYEWVYAGFLNIKNTTGTMKNTSSPIEKIYFGFNEENFFLRIDFIERNFDQIAVQIYKETIKKIFIDLNNNVVKLNNNDEHNIIFAVNKCLEISIPFEDLQIQKGEQFMFNVMIFKNMKVENIFPQFSYIPCIRPDKYFKIANWRV